MVRSKEMISLVTDSSCDLPLRLLERFKIAVVPLVVHIDAESYMDGELSIEAFWERAAGSSHTPQTSRPSVGAFERVFERLVERGEQVLCITLTGEHTGTIETARLAARRFGEAVRVFDSQSLSLGMGFQVLEAARAIELGRSMEDVLALLEDLQSRVHAVIVLDTLENVRRGGRADSFIAVVGRMSRMLNIKPIVNFVEGRVQLLGVTRSFRRGIERLLDMAEELGPLERLAVMHARNVERAEALADRLAERLGFPRDEILVGETGAVVASHAGAGAIGIFAVSKRLDRRTNEGALA
jgi:DegV family protein with EDD domain